MSETKKRIFDQSIELVCNANFESVSMRDIAEAVGIKAASIYNHFSSKQELLDTYYSYYEQHVFDRRLPLEQIKEIVEQEDRQTIVYSLAMATRVYHAGDEYVERLTKILYERRICDQVAAELYLSTFYNQVHYIQEALSHGIQIGRIRDFPVRGFSHAFVSQYTCMTVNRFILPPNPQRPEIQLISEEELLEWLCHPLVLNE